MPRFDGSLARTLDFGETTTTGVPASPAGRNGLRLTLRSALSGPHKYKVLERRRRHAQIAARRALDLTDVAEDPGRATEEGK
jgi:hypothetical protein